MFCELFSECFCELFSQCFCESFCESFRELWISPRKRLQFAFVCWNLFLSANKFWRKAKQSNLNLARILQLAQSAKSRMVFFRRTFCLKNSNFVYLKKKEEKSAKLESKAAIKASSNLLILQQQNAKFVAWILSLFLQFKQKFKFELWILNCKLAKFKLKIARFLNFWASSFLCRSFVKEIQTTSERSFFGILFSFFSLLFIEIRIRICKLLFFSWKQNRNSLCKRKTKFANEKRLLKAACNFLQFFWVFGFYFAISRANKAILVLCSSFVCVLRKICPNYVCKLKHFVFILRKQSWMAQTRTAAKLRVFCAPNSELGTLNEWQTEARFWLESIHVQFFAHKTRRLFVWTQFVQAANLRNCFASRFQVQGDIEAKCKSEQQNCFVLTNRIRKTCCEVAWLCKARSVRFWQTQKLETQICDSQFSGNCFVLCAFCSLILQIVLHLISAAWNHS